MKTQNRSFATGNSPGRLMQKAYADGVEGFGKNLHNLYRSTGAQGIKHREWERGYDTAYFLNLKRVLKEENKENIKVCGS
jgi:hypothetical protein